MHSILDFQNWLRDSALHSYILYRGNCHKQRNSAKSI